MLTDQESESQLQIPVRLAINVKMQEKRKKERKRRLQTCVNYLREQRGRDAQEGYRKEGSVAGCLP